MRSGVFGRGCSDASKQPSRSRSAGTVGCTTNFGLLVAAGGEEPVSAQRAWAYEMSQVPASRIVRAVTYGVRHGVCCKTLWACEVAVGWARQSRHLKRLGGHGCRQFGPWVSTFGNSAPPIRPALREWCAPDPCKMFCCVPGWRKQEMQRLRCVDPVI